MTLTKYEEMMLKHAQIQTSMMAVQLTMLAGIAFKLDKELNFIEEIKGYNAYVDRVDAETCKVLGTTQEC